MRQALHTGTPHTLHSRVVPSLVPVTSESSDEEILNAIDMAGCYIASTKPPERAWDWRECEGKAEDRLRVYQYAFVHWYDISNDWDIIPRLRDMIEQGILTGSLQSKIEVTHLKRPRPHQNPYR